MQCAPVEPFRRSGHEGAPRLSDARTASMAESRKLRPAAMKAPALLAGLALLILGCGPAKPSDGLEDLGRELEALDTEWRELSADFETATTAGDLRRLCRRLRAWSKRFERVEEESRAYFPDDVPAALWVEQLRVTRKLRERAAAIQREACAP